MCLFFKKAELTCFPESRWIETGQDNWLTYKEKTKEKLNPNQICKQQITVPRRTEMADLPVFPQL